MEQVQTTPRRTIEILQIMRTFSAMIVLLSHLFTLAENRFFVYFTGRLGVAFFFMISGFLLVYTDHGKTKGYFRKRFIRLVPLYWLTTWLVFAIGLVMPSFLHTATADLPSLLKSMFFIPFRTADGIFPLYPIGWTLTAEVFLYVLYFIPTLLLRIPMFHARFSGKEIIGKAIFTSAVLILLVILRQIFPGTLFLDAYGAKYMLYFVIGLLLASAWEQIMMHTQKIMLPARPQKWVSWIMVAGIGMLFLGSATIFRENYLSIIALGVLFVVLLLVFWNMQFPKLFVMLGNISYSFYLIHYFVVKGYVRLVCRSGESTAFTGIAAFLACYFLTAFLAYFSYRIVEVWLSKQLKKAFRLTK